MSNLLTDKTATLPPSNKVDLQSVPGGFEQYYLSSSEWNTAARFLEDTRIGLLHPQVQWTGSENYGEETLNAFNLISPLTGTCRWIFVRPNGNNVTGDGAYASPYATIQHALDQLPKNLGDTTYFIDITGMNHDDAVSGSLVFPSCMGRGVAGGVHNYSDLLGFPQVITTMPQGAPSAEYVGYWAAMSQVNLIALPQKYESFSICDWIWPLAGTSLGSSLVTTWNPTVLFGVAVEASVLGFTSSLDPQLNVLEPGETPYDSFSDNKTFFMKYTGNYFPIISTNTTSSGSILYNVAGCMAGFYGAPALSSSMEVYVPGASFTGTVRFNDTKYSLGFMGLDMVVNSSQFHISNSKISFDFCGLYGDSGVTWNRAEMLLYRTRCNFPRLGPNAGSLTRIWGSAINGLRNSSNAALPASTLFVLDSYIESGRLNDHAQMFAYGSRFHDFAISDGDSIYAHVDQCSLGKVQCYQDSVRYAPAQINIVGSALVDNPWISSGSTIIQLNNVDANVEVGAVASNDPGFYPNRIAIDVANAPRIRAYIDIQASDLSRSYVDGIDAYEYRFLSESREDPPSGTTIPYLRFAEMGRLSKRRDQDGTELDSYICTNNGSHAYTVLSNAGLTTGSTGIKNIGHVMHDLLYSDGAEPLNRILSGGAEVNHNIIRDAYGYPLIEIYRLMTGSITEFGEPFKTVEYSYGSPGVPVSKLVKVYGYASRPVSSYYKSFIYDMDEFLIDAQSRLNSTIDLGW
jgi:hypothetical protein